MVTETVFVLFRNALQYDVREMLAVYRTREQAEFYVGNRQGRLMDEYTGGPGDYEIEEMPVQGS